ncbi:MAG: hypothetical protein KIT84_28740 [Labilithrix sp.]|nr:hypothetical protein [Labilithrix sp.]MCW5815048.1 hypothetical protein [Labilithrix sp.]
MSHFSRRNLLKSALAAAGAAAGSRIGGPLVKSAWAAPAEPAHFVHIFFNGGLNALFAGNADKFIGKAFGVTAPGTTGVGAAVEIGNGVFTDAGTFGGVSAFAKQHWGAIGMKHGQALHTTPQNRRSGGERAILINGAHSYLNELAAHMGGDSAFKAVYFGDRAPAYVDQPVSFNNVPLQRVSDLKDALAAANGSDGADSPTRPEGANTLETSQTLSKRQLEVNPSKLATLDDAYKSQVESLRKPLPPPVTFDEIDKAYNLGGKSDVTSVYAAMLAGAEIMIRAAGSNVVHVGDYGLASWDFHQVGTGGSLNGTFSRNKLKGNVGGFGSSRINPIKIFLQRMLEMPDRNVVVAISGELVRLPSGDHGDGTVAMLFGKHVKTGVSYGVTSEGARFAPGTPTPKGFWAAVAAALKVPGAPFGENPHAKLIA